MNLSFFAAPFLNSFEIDFILFMRKRQAPSRADKKASMELAKPIRIVISSDANVRAANTPNATHTHTSIDAIVNSLDTRGCVFESSFFSISIYSDQKR